MKKQILLLTLVTLSVASLSCAAISSKSVSYFLPPHLHNPALNSLNLINGALHKFRQNHKEEVVSPEGFTYTNVTLEANLVIANCSQKPITYAGHTVPPMSSIALFLANTKFKQNKEPFSLYGNLRISFFADEKKSFWFC